MEIAKTLNSVWMELRIQESALWDYSLYRGATHLHCFSTLPAYWDNDPETIESQRGNLGELCDAWQCDKERVKNYLRQWKTVWPWYSYAFAWIKAFYSPPSLITAHHWYECMFLTSSFRPKGKAYPADNCEYGDYWQMFDFLRALDAPNPLDLDKDGKQHRLILPDAKTITAAL